MAAGARAGGPETGKKSPSTRHNRHPKKSRTGIRSQETDLTTDEHGSKPILQKETRKTKRQGLDGHKKAREDTKSLRGSFVTACEQFGRLRCSIVGRSVIRCFIIDHFVCGIKFG